MHICIYGASSNQISEGYIHATEELGSALAQAGHVLVYGAGGAGLMGAAARGFKKHQGTVIGVVPRFLKVDGILYDHCDELIYTDTMRERKQIMEDRSDAFVVTPGGIGTFEEFFEIYTLKQLGRHRKPIVLYNIEGYYDELLAMLDKAVLQSFMRSESLPLVHVAHTSQDVIAYLQSYHANQVDIQSTKYV